MRLCTTATQTPAAPMRHSRRLQPKALDSKLIALSSLAHSMVECGRAERPHLAARRSRRTPTFDTQANVPPTIISKKASNWVDRGDPPNPTLRRILAHYFDRFDPTDEAWLEEHALVVLGMVAADATEIQIAGYLRSVVNQMERPPQEPRSARATAISLWHVAKAALVRDFAERVLRSEVPPNEPTNDSLSHWVASRLLTPEELARFEREARTDDERR